MAAFDPVTNQYEPAGACCEICGAEVEWDECGLCGGDGIVEHEPDVEEPWTGFEPCGKCGGRGGWNVCPHAGEPEHVREVTAP